MREKLSESIFFISYSIFNEGQYAHGDDIYIYIDDNRVTENTKHKSKRRFDVSRRASRK